MRLKGEQFSKPTYFVCTSGDFKLAVEDLEKSRLIGVDTESNSLFAFHECVCAVQISNSRSNYIFDPLQLEDLQLLEGLFSNPKIEKIFHGGDYDIGLLKRDFGFTFNNIFDSFIVAMFLNIEKLGMADLVEASFGIRLEKKFTKCNWAKRPLHIEQMVYLCQDTQYLMGVREWLLKMVVEKDLSEEIELEFSHLEKRPPLEHSYKNQTIWDVKGAKGLEKENLPILFELFKWRKAQAKKQNMPPFKIMNNSTLIALAQIKPTIKKEMFDITGITTNTWTRYGQTLLNAIRKGEKYPRDWTPPPTTKKVSETRKGIHWNDQELVDALKEWRTARARGIGIHPLAVLPGHTLEDISREKPSSIQDFDSIESFGKKRTKIYGEEILNIIKKIG